MGMGMGGTVVEEVVYVLAGGFGGIGLFGGEGTEGYVEGAIDGMGIVQQFSKDFLDM